MATSTPSRIPHLARAIIERRKLCSISDHARQNVVVHGLTVATRRPCDGRRHASSSRPARPKPLPNAISKPPLPLKGRAAAPSLSPMRSPAPRPPPPPPPPSQLDDIETPLKDGQYDPDKDPVKIRRYRTAKFGFVVVVTGFIAYVYQSYQNDVQRYYAKGNILTQDADVSSRWKDATRNFDREVDDAETIMLLKWKRKRLVREAYGDVLEVSVGTGRNMDLYDTRPYSPTESSSYGRDTRHMITSLTFNDESPVMIENAKKKWAEKQRQKRVPDRFTGQIDWHVGDAGQRGVIPRPPGGYDTIVQSWGICSMQDPVKFLRHLGRLVRQPGEKIINSSPEKLRYQEEEDGLGGRIFLLEHGRGKYDWINKFLDQSAPMHADRYGCWYNKDIDQVIQNSGLVVERTRRYNFGTTYEYILRPAPGQLPGEEDVVDASQTSEVEKPAQRGWLSKLW